MISIRKLRRAFHENLMDVLTSSNFTIAAFLLFAVLFVEIARDAFSVPWQKSTEPGMGDAYYFDIALHFGYYIYAAPLLCAFASGGLLCNDLEAGFYKVRLMKSGKREYEYGQFFGSTIGGGLSLMAGVLLFIVACMIIYPPCLMGTDFAVMDGWLSMIGGPMGNVKYMLANAGLAFVFGMIWSGAGLIFSVFSPNRYVSTLVPFIVCFCLTLVLPPQFQPLEMLVQMRWTSFSIWNLMIYQALLYIVEFVLFCFLFERRILDE